MTTAQHSPCLPAAAISRLVHLQLAEVPGLSANTSATTLAPTCKDNAAADRSLPPPGPWHPQPLRPPARHPHPRQSPLRPRRAELASPTLTPTISSTSPPPTALTLLPRMATCGITPAPTAPADSASPMMLLSAAASYTKPTMCPLPATSALSKPWPASAADSIGPISTPTPTATFAPACDTCQHHKASNQPPGGLLHPLPIPYRRWQSISIDRIVQLPRTANSLDAILTVVDRLSEMIHIRPHALLPQLRPAPTDAPRHPHQHAHCFSTTDAFVAYIMDAVDSAAARFADTNEIACPHSSSHTATSLALRGLLPPHPTLISASASAFAARAVTSFSRRGVCNAPVLLSLLLVICF